MLAIKKLDYILNQWFKKKTSFHQVPVETLFPVLPAEKLLKEERVARQIKQIKELLSITKESYTTYYLPPLIQLAVRVQQLPALEKGPYHIKGGFLQLTLQRTLVALKYRRSLMLPMGGTPETQYREHDIWTYAVFTASLLRDCWLLSGYEIYLEKSKAYQRCWNPLTGPMPPTCSYRFKLMGPLDITFKASLNALMVPQLLSYPALHWLYQAPHVFKEWLACLSAAGHSTLHEVIEQAQEAILPHQTDTAVANDLLSDEKTVFLAKEAAEEVILTEEQSLPDLFFDWLKQSWKSNSPLCQPEQRLTFRTSEGIVVVWPTLVEHFITAYQKQLEAWIPDKAKALLPYLREQLLASPYIQINPERANGLYQYYFGEWKTRDVIEGLLIKPHCLFKEDEYPPIYPDCHLDLS